MRFSTWIASITLRFIAPAKEGFERPDFNAAKALLGQGVNTSSIADLQGGRAGPSQNACSDACTALLRIYGNDTIYPQNSSAYQTFTNSYWSIQQASVSPYCIFKPLSTRDVSRVVLLSRLTQCPFAVKSGGHTSFAGGSSIKGGITVALEKLNRIELSSDKKVVSVGPGSLWWDVYTTLEKENLSVIGGRVADIGVGGLLLGGGISIFSNQYGWACDNVASYEVVTASGPVITASPTSYPDLYWALRGGGNNFGIVTKFNLETFPQSMIRGGYRMHAEEFHTALIEAFYNFGTNASSDPKAAQILTFGTWQSDKLVSVNLDYAEPFSETPPIFSEYFSVPATSDNVMVRSVANRSLQFKTATPPGFRQTDWTATFKLEKDFITFIKDVFFEELPAIANASGLVPCCTLQVITEPQLARMSRNGGNPLGLDTSCGSLLLLEIYITWSNIEDDARILNASENIIKRSVDEARKKGLANDYLYMNYASEFQAVVSSYGTGNQKRLKEIAEKYDPKSVFQTLQPGYFKLDGAPISKVPDGREKKRRSNKSDL